MKMMISKTTPIAIIIFTWIESSYSLEGVEFEGLLPDSPEVVVEVAQTSGC